jgi:hypothetical protein
MDLAAVNWLYYQRRMGSAPYCFSVYYHLRGGLKGLARRDLVETTNLCLRWLCSMVCKEEVVAEETKVGLKIKELFPGLEAKKVEVHLSDCTMHNAPAMKPGPCTCGAVKDVQ